MMRLEHYKLFIRPWRLAAAFLAMVVMKGVIFVAVKAGAFGEVANGFAYMAISATYTLYLVSFLLCSVAAASLSGEEASGLLRMYLARPVSRSAYLLNRVLYLLVLAFLILILDALAGTALGWAGFGFTDVADPKLYGKAFSASSMALACMEGYLLTFLGLAGLAALGLLISVLIRTPSTAISTAMAVFFLMEGLRLIFREPLSLFMVTRYTRAPMEHLSSLARSIAAYQPPDYLFRALCVPMGFLLIFSTIALVVFRRRDVLQ